MDYVNPQTDPSPAGERFRAYQTAMRADNAQGEGLPLAAYSALSRNPDKSPEQLAAEIQAKTAGLSPDDAQIAADGYLREEIQRGLFAGGVPLPIAKVLAQQELHIASQDARITKLEAK
jgi:hypothetical protein